MLACTILLQPGQWDLAASLVTLSWENDALICSLRGHCIGRSRAHLGPGIRAGIGRQAARQKHKGNTCTGKNIIKIPVQSSLPRTISTGQRMPDIQGSASAN